MPILTLLVSNWFDLLQSAAIVSGFIYTALAFSLDSRSRRAELFFESNKAYQMIWSKLLVDPTLSRILEPSPDLKSIPVTKNEERFTLLLLMHLGSVHYAMDLGLYRNWPGIEEDIRRFFTLPIPSRVLKKYLALQDPSFREYLRGIFAP